MVTGFSPRVLAIANNEHLLDWVEVLPKDASNLVLPHGGRDGETEDASNRNELPCVRFERRNNAIELFLRRPAIALISLPDQAQARQGNACEDDWLHQERDTMHRSRVRKDRLDVSEINAQSDGACSLASSLLAKLDETLAIEFGNFADSKPALLEMKTRRLRPTDRLTDFTKVRHMQPNEIAECSGVTSLAFGRRFATVYPTFLVDRPYLGVFSTEKCLADILPFPTHLNSPGTGSELREGRHGVCAPCALSCRKAAKSIVSRRTLECTRRDLRI